MTRRMSIEQTREQLADILGMVRDGQEPVIVEKRGKPMAVLISPDQFEYFQQLSRDQLARVTEELWQLNADTDPDEVERDVSAAVEEVRQARYDRRA